MRKLFFALLMIAVCSIQCDDPAQKQSKKTLSPTEIFNSYLQRKFETSIPDSLHYYILIPKYGCIGCMQRGLIKLNEIITDQNNAHFTYIVSNRLEKVNTIYEGKGYQTLTDSTGDLDLLNLRISNLVVLKTLDKKIQSTFYLNVENLSQFPAIF